jgi:spore germination protein YaaH
LIPKGSAAGFAERYYSLLQQWLTERKESVYTIKKGDNLSNIAARFNVPVKAIMIWNGITNGKKVTPGDKLIIFSKNQKTENNNGHNTIVENPRTVFP